MTNRQCLSKAESNLRRDALERQWGSEHGDRRVFDNPGCSVEVLVWRKGTNPLGVNLYMTVGLPQLSDHTRHVEVLMIGLEPDPDNASWLLGAIASLRGLGKWRGSHGSTFTFDEPLWHDTAMSAAMVVEIDDEDLIELGDGRHISLVRVLPLHSDELPLAIALGPDRFLERCEPIRVPFSNPRRPSYAVQLSG